MVREVRMVRVVTVVPSAFRGRQSRSSSRFRWSASDRASIAVIRSSRTVKAKTSRGSPSGGHARPAAPSTRAFLAVPARPHDCFGDGSGAVRGRRPGPYGRGVGPQHHLRVEELPQGGRVAAPRGREEGRDDLPLA